MFLLLTEGEVVATFQGRCEGFFRGGREPAGFRNEATLQICQQYKGRARFATLYNSNLRLPVYSAYLLHPHGMSAREDSWLIEPQVKREREREREKMKQIGKGNSQALEEDYKGDPYDRGHLNPVAHQAGTNREATFTLTNVAPMHRTLNRGSWRVCEEQLRDLSSSLCPPGVPVYVLTGTSPPFLGKIPVTSPGRVSVPRYVWSSLFCKLNASSSFSLAHVGDNELHTVSSMKVSELETLLALHYGRRISLYPNSAPKSRKIFSLSF
uniref:Endonuclease n=1 Tax=Callorhinchus milii TaxID=7868 RepID=A0A4W3H735_CALMI